MTSRMPMTRPRVLGVAAVIAVVVAACALALAARPARAVDAERDPLLSPTTPMQITDLAVTQRTTTSVSLSWTTPGDGGSPILAVELAYAGEGQVGLTYIQLDPLATSATISGLTPGVNHVAAVRAVNAQGPADFSNVVEARTSELPSVPRAFTVVPIDATTLRFSWIAPELDGGLARSNYVLSMEIPGSGTFDLPIPSDATTWDLRAFVTGVDYSFRLAAVNLEGTGPSTPTVTAAAIAAPSAPVLLRAPSNTSSSVRLTWTRPMGSTASSILDYRIDRSTDGATWTEVTHAPSTATSFDVTGLTHGGAYYFRVAAVNATGLGAYAYLDGSIDVATGTDSTCAVRSSGAVWCWGLDVDGRLGLGSSSGGVQSSPVEVVGLTDAVQISTNHGTTCAMRVGGTVRCWGANGSGQIGDGTTTTAQSPTDVVGLTDVRRVSVGDGYACALRNDGSVACWGSGAFGKLGNGMTDDHSTPVDVDFAGRFVGIATADDHACGVDVTGEVHCWGSNGSGQFGLNSPYESATPIHVLTDGLMVEVSAKGRATCSLRATGVVQCWGDNFRGQLGDRSGSNQYAPENYALPAVVDSVSVGDEHVCVVMDDSSVRCWGNLATTGIDVHFSSVATAGPGTEKLSDGPRHSCGLYFGALVMCGGDNTNGQLGDGTTTSRTTAGPHVLEPAIFDVVTVPGTPTLAIFEKSTTIIRMGATAPVDDGGRSINLYTFELCSAGSSCSGGSIDPSQIGEFHLPQLVKGTSYEFRMAAETEIGVGPMASISFYAAVPPAIPTGLRVMATTSRTATLAWTDGDTGGRPITDHRIETSVGGGEWRTFAHGASTATSYTVTGLTTGANVSFRVAAVNGEGTGSTSSSVSSEIVGVPDAPGSLSVVSKTTNSLSLRWAAPSNNGGRPIEKYKVEYQRAGTSSWTEVNRTSPASITQTITGLTKGSNHTVRVTAMSSLGWGAAASIVAIPAVKAGAPTGLATTARTATSVSLKWTAPTDNGGRSITDYKVEYQRAGNPAWTTFAHTASSATTSTVTGLTTGASYTFRVSTVTGEGAGTASTTIAVTPYGRPGAPTALTVTSKTTSSVTLRWVAPSNNGGRAVSDYKVEYQRAGTTTWTPVAHTASTAIAITVPNLTKGTSYTFRVAAVNSEGTGDATSLSDIPAVKPGAPTNLRSTAKTATSVTLAWTAPTDNGGRAITDYRIEYQLASATTWTAFAHTASNATTRVVSGLTRNSNYRFRVSTVTAEGASTPTSQVNVTPSMLEVSPSAVPVRPARLASRR